MNCSFHPLVAMDFLVGLAMQKQQNKNMSGFFLETLTKKRKKSKKTFKLYIFWELTAILATLFLSKPLSGIFPAPCEPVV